ncbi:hypothetical protein Vretimale_18761 [Volvox reticuliferus]|uniref:Geranylgeranyl transferase type II subunit beta n=1 Tax=Volvox reticuliferus TaxID=1737510 RepID=A0A8J4GVJ4_9CHLO|nr:hypothetical protein Vretimale_18761 [Volvox reticuliferus]
MLVALRLCERQTKTGGLNGRPEKLQDVCYSWWCLSCLSILGHLHWIDREALTRFILDCQDEEDGGISDRPDDMADVYHTFFGIAGLSLMGYPGLAPIDPTWALPVEVVQRVKKRAEAAVAVVVDVGADMTATMGVAEDQSAKTPAS